VKTSALLTNMETPLGRTAGNGLEVIESIESLRGEGPEDLMEVTLALAREMLDLAGATGDPAAAIGDGRALAKWNELVRAQGGDPNATLPEAPERRQHTATTAGWIRSMDARCVGVAAWRLGAGRARKEDPVSASAGVVCLKKPGDRVEEGEPILDLRAESADRFEEAIAALDGAIEIGAEEPEPQTMVLERIA
jgi:thymidine phosphorylase